MRGAFFRTSHAEVELHSGEGHCGAATAAGRLVALGAALVSTASLAGATGPDDPIPLPAARYEVHLESTVLVPMRDGVRLSTDLYLPVGAGERLPVILIRTQYDKRPYREPEDMERGAARMFAGQGFAVAVQDIRGRFESEGEYMLARHDGPDGYDTIDWLARQPWSNGNIGTYGCSSLGNTQIFAAQHRHPNHKTMIPQHAGGASHTQLWDVVTAGVIEIGWAPEWFYVDGSKLFSRPPPGSSREQVLEYYRHTVPQSELPKVDFEQVIRSLPVIDMGWKPGWPPNDWRDYVVRAFADPYWKRLGYFGDESKIDVPALSMNSWYDMSPHEALYMFNRFRENAVSRRARDNQYVILSPTGHCQSESAGSSYSYGHRPLGDPRKDYWAIYLRWFDHWLRGEKRGLGDLPRVQYYLMGRNEWRSAGAWPLPGTQFTRWYLHSGGKANSRFGDGLLSTEPPRAQPADSFVYDPGSPVPSLGYNTPGGKFNHDQRDIEARQDVLVYTTPPLAEGIEVTGPVEALLYVSSTAKDTDFTAKLVDVYPDGRAFNLREGIARARYREGFDRQVWMKPGEVYEISIDLQVTGNYFGPGHRIRLEVSSSNFPRFERNLNTGGRNYDETGWIVATNTIHHGGAHASALVLPVVPER
jgi:putative CocE/NonD family hydrolase